MVKTQITNLMNRLTEQLDFGFLRSAKVWIFLALTTLTLTIGGYIGADRHGLLIGFLCSVALNAWVIFYDELHLFSLFPSTELEGHDAWGLLRMTKELASRLRMKSPRLFLVKTTTPLSFSAGILPMRSTVFLSSALLDRLQPDELRSVLAFELLRIQSKQTRTASVVSSLTGLLVSVANGLDSVLLLRFLRRRKPCSWGPFLWLVSPFVAVIVHLSIPRRSFLEFDQKVTQLIDQPKVWPQTLLKLDSYIKTMPLDISLADAPLFTVNPLARYRWCRFALAQPTIETRLQALTGRFPL